jgi:hypothetical protein
LVGGTVAIFLLPVAFLALVLLIKKEERKKGAKEGRKEGRKGDEGRKE